MTLGITSSKLFPAKDLKPVIVICSCGLQVSISKDERERQAVVCKNCNATVDLTDPAHTYDSGFGESQFASSKSSLKLDSKLKNLVLSPSWNVSWKDGGYVISWRWFESSSPFLLAVCAIGSGVTGLNFLQKAISDSANSSHFVPIIFILLVASTFAYNALASYLNHTDVKLIQRELVVSSGPVPWASGKRLRVSDLKDFSIFKEPGSKVAHGTYKLCGLTRTGETIPIVGGINTEKNAMLLAVALADLIGIKT